MATTRECIDVPTAKSIRLPSERKASALAKLRKNHDFWTAFRLGYWKLAFGHLYDLIAETIGGTDGADQDMQDKINLLIADFKEKMNSTTKLTTQTEVAKLHLKDIESMLDNANMYSATVKAKIDRINDILSEKQEANAEFIES